MTFSDISPPAGTGEPVASVSADPIPLDPIEGQRELNKRMANIRRIDNERADTVRRFEQEISRQQATLADRLDVLDRAREFDRLAVQSWHIAMHAAGRVRQTVHTPHGVSRLTIPKKPVVSAPSSLTVEWAKEHAPEMTKTSVSVPVSLQAKAVTALDDGRVVLRSTGEVLDGWTSHVPTPRVSIVADEGEPL